MNAGKSSQIHAQTPTTGTDHAYIDYSIGSARFMKTIRGLHKDSLVIVKIFVKPEQGLSLQRYVQRLEGTHSYLVAIRLSELLFGLVYIHMLFLS